MSNSWEIKTASAGVLKSLQIKFAGVRYHIWDEISMIGLRTFFKLHYRLTEIYGTESDEEFGGQNVIIIGDLAQLVPVQDNPIYLKPRFINPLLSATSKNKTT